MQSKKDRLLAELGDCHNAIKGSLAPNRRRCGKPQCRCMQGEFMSLWLSPISKNVKAASFMSRNISKNRQRMPSRITIKSKKSLNRFLKSTLTHLGERFRKKQKVKKETEEIPQVFWTLLDRLNWTRPRYDTGRLCEDLFRGSAFYSRVMYEKIMIKHASLNAEICN